MQRTIHLNKTRTDTGLVDKVFLSISGRGETLDLTLGEFHQLIDGMKVFGQGIVESAVMVVGEKE